MIAPPVDRTSSLECSTTEGTTAEKGGSREILSRARQQCRPFGLFSHLSLLIMDNEDGSCPAKGDVTLGHTRTNHDTRKVADHTQSTPCYQTVVGREKGRYDHGPTSVRDNLPLNRRVCASCMHMHMWETAVCDLSPWEEGEGMRYTRKRTFALLHSLGSKPVCTARSSETSSRHTLALKGTTTHRRETGKPGNQRQRRLWSKSLQVKMFLLRGKMLKSMDKKIRRPDFMSQHWLLHDSTHPCEQHVHKPRPNYSRGHSAFGRRTTTRRHGPSGIKPRAAYLPPIWSRQNSCQTTCL